MPYAKYTRQMLEPAVAASTSMAGGDAWNGRALTLHVDHIDGCFWDCRPGNLRILCPNCHSQTSTYAGRNRRRGGTAVVRVDGTGAAVAPDGTISHGDDERAAVLRRAEAKELTVADAARMLGCARSHVYELQRRLRDNGSLARPPRQPRTVQHHATIVALALRRPEWGPRKIAAALALDPDEPRTVAHGTVSNVLRRAGLSSRAARAAVAHVPEPTGHG